VADRVQRKGDPVAGPWDDGGLHVCQRPWVQCPVFSATVAAVVAYEEMPDDRWWIWRVLHWIDRQPSGVMPRLGEGRAPSEREAQRAADACLTRLGIGVVDPVGGATDEDYAALLAAAEMLR